MSEGAGWFADPGGKVGTLRWWDGDAWTRWLNADPAGPPPEPTAPPAEPEPALAPEPEPEIPAAAEAPDPSILPPPDPADRVVRLPAAAAIVVGVVLLAVIAVGAIVTLTADRPLTGPAVAPPPATQAPTEISYDATTRTASFEEMRFLAPNAPFACDLEPREVPGTFVSSFGCTAVIHRNYDRANSDWVAVVRLGPLDPSLREGGDLKIIAARTFAAVASRNYRSAGARVEKKKTEDLVGTGFPVGKAVLVSAEIHVSVQGLPTTYDRAVLAVIELESGQHVAWYALRADDSPKDVVMALQDSAETINARK